MTKAFYLKYLVYGSLWGCLAAYIYYSGFNHGHSIGMYLMFGLSAVLFPLAKCLIETLALKYTTREFWTRGLLVETPAKNGLYAMYHMVCFIFSIPLGIVYLLINKNALQGKV
ncbi:Colicin E1 (microcin) immunity protein [Serratia quinivorans]|uniref:colicin E1 immunity protein n=1 Tax=Serratia quinivorans TaxID=137545 RepID=UPI002179DBFD|nr:colicin E1 immunity protein [Serratia quinivorans]CAI1546938.1 Colicin E1 (microcin) immunity protein [Serratia quinivorans]CAI1703852.1 Colicin E1 (microcin) immunity protein [Serratia quinivorans]CAI1717021.1 Colicin E1 (microcin) immunity protein [Serratia quinivorans]